jgi:hypothetical protein
MRKVDAKTTILLGDILESVVGVGRQNEKLLSSAGWPKKNVALAKIFGLGVLSSRVFIF